MGKSSEAQNGAATVVQGLLRSIRGLKENDQTYDVVLELLETLSRELPTVRHHGVHHSKSA